MNELIKITEHEGRQAVSARELHSFLEASERFSSWCKRMFKYGFVENQDYVGCKQFNTLANQELEDYALTIGCAKEISMLQRSPKGKQARQYFIACEQVLIGILNGQLNQATEILKERFMKSSRVKEIDKDINNLLTERRRLVRDINFIDRLDFRQLRINLF